MIERQLNAFGLALFGVVMTLFLTVFAVTPIVCGVHPYVQLPWAKSSQLIAGSETDLEIHIKKDRSIFVGLSRVPRADLASALRELAARSRDRHVLISADGAVPYESVEQVLAAARDAGFSRVSLITFRGTRIEAMQRGGAV